MDELKKSITLLSAIITNNRELIVLYAMRNQHLADDIIAEMVIMKKHLEGILEVAQDVAKEG